MHHMVNSHVPCTFVSASLYLINHRQPYFFYGIVRCFTFT